MNDATGLVLPSIQRVILRNFSLYSAEPLIDIAFPKGVSSVPFHPRGLVRV